MPIEPALARCIRSNRLREGSEEDEESAEFAIRRSSIPQDCTAAGVCEDVVVMVEVTSQSHFNEDEGAVVVEDELSATIATTAAATAATAS